MSRLPTGAVTFLFTDIEKSTRMWAEHPDLMAPALERHDALMQAAIESGGGHVFKTVGDAFHAAFASPSDALAVAVDAQRSLQAEDWDESAAIRVRMAVHAGEAEVRGGDYFGTTLNRCARVLGLGHGNQVLLSHAAAELVRDHLPPCVSLRDMGEHRLKDLALTERVYQVDVEGLPSTFPALVSLDVHAHNLPRQLTSLVGRDSEIADLVEVISRHRLVTLTGVGGTGKTRLALQVAADTVADYPGGAWYVELAPVTDSSRISRTVANVLSLREEEGRPILDTLTDHLAQSGVLLLLDNCEHVLEASARLAEHLLQATSTVRILATSRESLGVPGEISRMVPSLELPEIGSEDDSGGVTSSVVSEVRAAEATRLFVERAQSAQPQFELTADNARSVVEVCRRLDGIPLAIELAAARVKLLPVEQVAERLDDRFRLLTGGSRTALPRQQTLQSAIDWSFDLLDAREKQLFSRLSVFVSSWTLEAAEALYTDDEAGPCEVLEVMSQLVDKSLVDVHGTAAPQRYRYLETIRQYARDKLARSDENHEARNRHVAYFASFAEDLTSGLTGPEQIELLDRLEAEHTNLTAALEWAVDGAKDLESSERLTVAMWRLWLFHNHFSEAAEWAKRVERMGAGSPASDRRAMVVYVAALTSYQLGDFAAAKSHYKSALGMFQECGDTVGESWVYNDVGLIHSRDGENEQAIACYEKAVQLKLERGDMRDAAATLGNIGELAWRTGDYDRAGEYYQRSLTLHDTLGDECDPRSHAIALHNLGELARCKGDVETSRRLYSDSLLICQRLMDTYGIAAGVAGIGGVAAAEGRPIRAAKLLAAADALREPVGIQLDDVNRREHDRMMADARSQLDQESWSHACAIGRSLTVDQAVDLALGDDD